MRLSKKFKWFTFTYKDGKQIFLATDGYMILQVSQKDTEKIEALEPWKQADYNKTVLGFINDFETKDSFHLMPTSHYTKNKGILYAELEADNGKISYIPAATLNKAKKSLRLYQIKKNNNMIYGVDKEFKVVYITTTAFIHRPAPTNKQRTRQEDAPQQEN